MIKAMKRLKNLLAFTFFFIICCLNLYIFWPSSATTAAATNSLTASTTTTTTTRSTKKLTHTEDIKLTKDAAIENYKNNTNVTTASAIKSFYDDLKSVIKCENGVDFQAQNEYRNGHYVIYNIVKAQKVMPCYTAITYTTHADYTFLDNLPVLVDLWRNPISIALYAPGTDFDRTFDSIRFLRDCVPLVADFVSFHVFFPVSHISKSYRSKSASIADVFDCTKTAPFLNVLSKDMYKSKKNLLYPINIARNVARLSARTYYILPSDIELYPSLDLPNKFLRMILNEPSLFAEKRTVFPLAIFEVEKTQKTPNNKTVLQAMLANKTAIGFHQKVCETCHKIPEYKAWMNLSETQDNQFHVFHTSKRKYSFYHWEPIYIGTNAEPLYDERLTWEGRSDKMTQAHIMCVLNYDFKVLDSGFLCHRPGIKTVKTANINQKLVKETNKLIQTEILPQIYKLYNNRTGCVF